MYQTETSYMESIQLLNQVYNYIQNKHESITVIKMSILI